MNTQTPVRYVVITDPDEIASIVADGFEDIIGGQLEDGTWIAEKESLVRWRERQQSEAGGSHANVD